MTSRWPYWCSKQWNCGRFSVPSQFCGSWPLFLCKRFLLSQYIIIDAAHVSESTLYILSWLIMFSRLVKDFKKRFPIADYALEFPTSGVNNYVNIWACPVWRSWRYVHGWSQVMLKTMARCLVTVLLETATKLSSITIKIFTSLSMELAGKKNIFPVFRWHVLFW